MRKGTQEMVEQNKRVYSRREIVNVYNRSRRELTAAEQICLEIVPPGDRFSILDIGIGTGRTTEPLAKMFKSYVGIDYSAEMVRVARAYSPRNDLRVMDARKLQFDRHFDCVMFSFNGIDYVDYADRQIILAEVSRNLRVGGYFIYSTHNIHYSRVPGYLNNRWTTEIWLSPLHLLLTPWRQVQRLINRTRNFSRQSAGVIPGVAYVNDPGESFDLITTYVDIALELQQLARHGFTALQTVGSRKQSPQYDGADPWVYIAAQKQTEGLPASLFKT